MKNKIHSDKLVLTGASEPSKNVLQRHLTSLNQSHLEKLMTGFRRIDDTSSRGAFAFVPIDR